MPRRAVAALRARVHHAKKYDRGKIMKLVRFGAYGQERPGVLDGRGKIRDLSGIVEDLSGASLGRESLSRIKSVDPETLPLVEGNPRLGAPVGVVPKFLGICLLYTS